jgi:hypothetical protein
MTRRVSIGARPQNEPRDERGLGDAGDTLPRAMMYQPLTLVNIDARGQGAGVLATPREPFAEQKHHDEHNEHQRGGYDHLGHGAPARLNRGAP